MNILYWLLFLIFIIVFPSQNKKLKPEKLLIIVCEATHPCFCNVEIVQYITYYTVNYSTIGQC